MTEPYTLNNAIEGAVNETLKKIAQKKLFKSDDNSDASEDFSNGDPETLWSIAFMYAQFIPDIDIDIAVCKIMEVLIKNFPEYE